MSTFPDTRHDMLRAGYRKSGDGRCRGCDAPIEWWKTSSGKSIPMNPIDDDRSPAVAHWATCPASKEFKGTPATPAAPPPDKWGPERTVRELRERTKARVVVLVDEHGTYCSWQHGLGGEDLRHDLISAANHIRKTIAEGDTTA